MDESSNSSYICVRNQVEMILELYNDINRFIDDTFDILAENEIQNNVIIGNCIKGRDGLDSSNWFLATIKDDSGAIRLIAMMTPPYNLCLYETGNTRDDGILNLFAKELAALNIAVPGIITEKSLAARFSDIYLKAVINPAACLRTCPTRFPTVFT